MGAAVAGQDAVAVAGGQVQPAERRPPGVGALLVTVQALRGTSCSASRRAEPVQDTFEIASRSLKGLGAEALVGPAGALLAPLWHSPSGPVQGHLRDGQPRPRALSAAPLQMAGREPPPCRWPAERRPLADGRPWPEVLSAGRWEERVAQRPRSAAAALSASRDCRRGVGAPAARGGAAGVLGLAVNPEFPRRDGCRMRIGDGQGGSEGLRLSA